jgi:integrase
MNSVWSMEKSLRACLKGIARKYKINVFNPVKEIIARDRGNAAKSDQLYLSFEHIRKIVDFKPESEGLRNAKLIFMILLFTGCRESDVYKILPASDYEKNGVRFQWSRFITLKTNTEIVVPILKPIVDALQENDGRLPKRVSQQQFNQSAREIAKLCGLNEEITFTYTDPHRIKKFATNKMYELVSSHVGRRSFITNLINFIPVTILTKITGHELADKGIIFSYNQISLMDNAALFVRELKRVIPENRDHFVVDLL